MANLIDLDTPTPQPQDAPQNPFAAEGDNLHLRLANMSMYGSFHSVDMITRVWCQSAVEVKKKTLCSIYY